MIVRTENDATGWRPGRRNVGVSEKCQCSQEVVICWRYFLKWIGWCLRQIGTPWNLAQVLNPSVLTRTGGRAMTRQWRKEKQSDLAKPGFSFDQWANLTITLTPDFPYTLSRRSAPVWGSHVWKSDYSGGTIIFASTPSIDEQCPLLRGSVQRRTRIPAGLVRT